MHTPYVIRPKSHIEKRRNRYFAVLDVPQDARPKIGKARLTCTLKTDSLAIAETRAAPIIARWRREIEKARGQRVETDIEFYRRLLTPAELAAIKTITVVELPDGRKVELDATTGEVVEEVVEAAAPGADITFADGKRRVYTRASVSRTTGRAFNHHVAEWHSASRVTQKTKDMQAADIKEFSTKFRTVEKVNKAAVKRWASDMIADGITPKTMQRKLSAIRSYWKHLQSVSAAPDDVEPFAGLNIGTAGGRVKREDRRQPFETGDVVKLLAAAKKGDDDELADLIELGRWTGARIEELCSLKVDDAKLRATVPHLTINAGKTDAAIREVPIHSKALPLVKRLARDSKDGYLVTGQPENKYGDRSNAIGKRFGRLKSEMGFGEQHVFHSIRKTVSTLLENAGVPENVAADIIGHDKPTMTYGLYSGGTSLAVKRDAVEKLRYNQ